MCAAIGGKVSVPTSAPIVAQESVNSTPAPTVTPTTTSAPAVPGTTDLAGMIARKKLTVMRTGILSTVRTGTGGVGDAPTLSAPGAAGGKSLLGQ